MGDGDDDDGRLDEILKTRTILKHDHNKLYSLFFSATAGILLDKAVRRLSLSFWTIRGKHLRRRRRWRSCKVYNIIIINIKTHILQLIMSVAIPRAINNKLIHETL